MRQNGIKIERTIVLKLLEKTFTFFFFLNDGTNGLIALKLIFPIFWICE
jgi:hypothetical protein